MSRPSSKKPKEPGTMLFRFIAIELIVVAALIGFGVYHYAGSLIGTVLGEYFGRKPADAGYQVYEGTLPVNEPAPTTAPAPTTVPETQPAPVTIKLTAVGDNLMHRSCTMAALQPDGSYNFENHFRHMGNLFHSADIAVISQDTVMGGMGFGASSNETGLFNTALEVGDAMVNAGINTVLAANNHILDQGRDGLQNMMNYWMERSFTKLLGVNATPQQKATPVYTEVDGIKVALINYTDVSIVSDVLTAEPFLVNYHDNSWLAGILDTARAEADFVVVFPFWGQQNQLDPIPDQTEQAQFLAEHGADLIIGTYPHVVEPVRWVTASNGHRTLVYYSLGNFQSIQNTLENMLGGIAQVEITKDSEGTAISSYGLDFTVTHYQQQGGADYYDIVTTYPLESYTDGLAEVHGLRTSGVDPEFSLAGLQGLASQVLQKSEMEQ